MNHARFRAAVVIWSLITVGWIGSLAVSTVNSSGGCKPGRSVGFVAVKGEWQWMPPGRACSYAEVGDKASFLTVPQPFVTINPTWTAPMLIGAGWLMVLLVAPARRRAGDTDKKHPEPEQTALTSLR